MANDKSSGGGVQKPSPYGSTTVTRTGSTQSTASTRVTNPSGSPKK